MIPRLTADRLRQRGFSDDYHECMLLANPRCSICHGLGIQVCEVCPCVLRTIFRRCWTRYHHFRVFVECGAKSKVWVTSGMNFCLPLSEYIADFEAVCSQWLKDQGAATTRAKILRSIYATYLILNLPWEESYRQARHIDPQLTEKRWWQYLTVLQEGMGRALKAVQPYPLHPVGEYFHSRKTRHNHLIEPEQIARPTRRRRPCT